MNDVNGVRRNVYPLECPYCGADLTKGAGILKYAVSGCQKLRVLKNGLSTPVSISRPAPMLSLCASCGGRIMTESAYLTEDGQLIAHSVPDDNDQDDLPSQLGGENIPQIENSGEK